MPIILFGDACGLVACPKASEFKHWTETASFSQIIDVEIQQLRLKSLDLSVGSLELGNNANFETIEAFNKRIDQLLEGYDLGYGGYLECRPFYSTDAYLQMGNHGPRWRTVHLGLDLWINAGTSVLALYEGVVESIQENVGERNYGPTIILKHKTEAGLEFYSLYGHLNRSCLDTIKKGASVKRGQQIAEIGPAPENGNWPPHLHFQIMLDLLGNEGDFPGVAYFDELSIWRSVCPDISEKLDFAKPKATETLTKLRF